MTARSIAHPIIVFLVLSCCGCTPGEIKYDLDYPRYYSKYTFEQLKDTLFSDTLQVSPDADGDFSQKKWYAARVTELLADLKSDWEKPDRIFPFTAFDQVKLSGSPWETDRTLTKDQATRLMQILSDPVCFDWSETTFEAEIIFEFLKNGKVIRSLSLHKDGSNVDNAWPAYKKMKFGGLKPEPQRELMELINDITKDR